MGKKKLRLLKDASLPPLKSFKLIPEKTNIVDFEDVGLQPSAKDDRVLATAQKEKRIIEAR